MSDMLEHGASGGAGPLPPSESHDEFLELCATATTGSLSTEERGRLRDHLEHCESCREIMAQYQALVDRVIPAWAPDPAQMDHASSEWSQDQAEAQLFARLSESDCVPGEEVFEPIPFESKPFAPPPIRASSGEELWRHMWVQFAAASLLVAALGLIAYRIGIRKGIDLAPHASIAASSRPHAGETTASTGTASKQAAMTATKETDLSLKALQSRLEQRLAEIDRLKARQAQTEKDLSLAEADRIKLAQDRVSLAQQLDVARGNLAAAEEKLDAATSQASQDGVRLAALQQKADQFAESMRQRDLEIVRERELLDHDRDIRELMGSRDLYIAEVYDVAKTGNTEKPFGRVFYTSGKSLIFYAYDLDQQAGIERASTFQAWGRRGPDRDHAVNLGILYQDNANKKRWVLKSDNPKTLAQIDAVFVTVEPNGGSSHPSGKPLLFAYLRIQPNHP
jgi:hypothetical protein